MRTPVQPRRPDMPLPELIGHMVYNMIFVAVFGFFALRQDSDPEDCTAVADDNKLAASLKSEGEEDADSVNVGYRFRLCFEVLFLTHLV